MQPLGCVRLRKRAATHAFTFVEAPQALSRENQRATQIISTEVYDFVESSVTRSVVLNGHHNFHYEEQLEKSGPMRDLVVTSWNEI